MREISKKKVQERMWIWRGHVLEEHCAGRKAKRITREQRERRTGRWLDSVTYIEKGLSGRKGTSELHISNALPPDSQIVECALFLRMMPSCMKQVGSICSGGT